MRIRNITCALVVLFITCAIASTASANCLTNLFSADVKVEDCRQELQREADDQRARSRAQELDTERHYYRMNYVACGDPRTGAMCSDPYGRPVGREGQWDSGYWWGGAYYGYYGNGYYGGRWYRRWYRQRYEYLYRYGEGDIDMMIPPDPPKDVFVREDRVWRCTNYERHWMCEVEKAKKTDVFVRNSPRGFPIYRNPPG